MKMRRSEIKKTEEEKSWRYHRHEKMEKKIKNNK
jgi:hypothetical protein